MHAETNKQYSPKIFLMFCFLYVGHEDSEHFLALKALNLHKLLTMWH